MQSKSGAKFNFLPAILLSAGVLFTGEAVAQQGVLEEVLVTAEKREQSIQELPISIEAFDAERLDTLQISSFGDISQHVPGLYDGPNSADVGGLKIYIRGVGSGDPQVGLDSRLALYVDGIYVGKTVGLAFDAVDLERVEVLKGPQGTLYGRNAVAGAINLISKKADPEAFDAKASVSVGNYSSIKVKGFVNIPLSDRLAVKFSAYLSELDGWVENKGVGEDFAGHEREGGRLDVAFIPNEQMRFDYSWEFTDSENQPLFYQSVDTPFRPSALSGLTYARYLAAPESGRQDEVNANFGLDRGLMGSDLGIESAEVETETHTLLGRWDWSEDHYTKLLIGYREVTARRFNIFWPEVDADCVAGTGPAPGSDEGAADCESLEAFFNRVLFTGVPMRADPLPVRTDLFSFQSDAEQAAFLAGVSLAGNSAVGGDTLMEPAESWSIELNQIGTLLDGRLEYTAGVYYFKEEIENSSEPYPHGAFGLLGGHSGGLLTYWGTYLAAVAPGSALRMGVSQGVEANRAMIRQGVAAGIACAQANGMYDGATGMCSALDAAALQTMVTGILSNAGLQSTLDTQTDAAVNAAVESGIRGVAKDQGLAAMRTARNGTNPAGWELDTEAWAVFGQVTYTPEGFDDRLHLTAGIRYSYDDKQGTLQPAFPYPRVTELPPEVLAAVNRVEVQNAARARRDAITYEAAIDPLEGDNDYDSLDPMVRVTWDVDENSIVYGSISRGFLSGGYNIALAGAGGFEFDKQNILAYEIGYKGDLMDNRLRLNAAAFYYEMDDDQTADTNPADPTSRAIANVDTTFEGAEISMTYVFSEALRVNLQYAYLDTGVDPFISNYNSQSEIDPITMRDDRTKPLRAENQRSSTGAPENSVNITVDYTAPLEQVLPWMGREGEFHAHLGYSHVDESFGSNHNPRDQNDLFNVEVGFTMPHENGMLKVALWAQNLFDNEYIIDSLVGRKDEGIRLFRCLDANGAPAPSGDECVTTELADTRDIEAGSVGSFGYDTVIYGSPRTWGLTVSYDYE